MKKTLSTVLALVMALALILGCVSFAAAEEAAPAGPVAYLMYADSAWAYQYWSGDAPEGVTPTNAEVTGPGAYTVGLEFAEEAQGLAFTAVGINDGEMKLPGYTITDYCHFDPRKDEDLKAICHDFVRCAVFSVRWTKKRNELKITTMETENE